MKILILSLFLFGCVTHKDLAQVGADNAVYHQQQEVVMKIEQHAQQLLNRQMPMTSVYFTRVECELKTKKAPLAVYVCDTHAFNVNNFEKGEVKIELVVDEKTLTITSMRAL